MAFPSGKVTCGNDEHNDQTCVVTITPSTSNRAAQPLFHQALPSSFKSDVISIQCARDIQVDSDILAHLRLNLQLPVHGDDEEIAVTVDECLLVHVGVAGVDVDGETFALHRATVAHHRPQTVNEVDLLVCLRLMRTPGMLSGGDVLLGIAEREICNKLQWLV